MLRSIVCRTEHFNESWFLDALRQTQLDNADAPFADRNVHRKVWEWVAVYQALSERGKLQPGSKGLGFAVGQEPLAGLFANRGAEVTATDIGDGEIANNWSTNGEHAQSKAALYHERLHNSEAFESLVSFQPADMKDLSAFDKGIYDFVWSACSLEHLGTLEDGLEFVKQSARLLRPGGVAVHTTEFNLTSDDTTIDAGETVIYREVDLKRLGRELRMIDAALEPLDTDAGTHEFDIKADYLPYHQNGRTHLKLRIGEYVSTSILLIVQN